MITARVLGFNQNQQEQEEILGIMIFIIMRPWTE